MLTCLHLGILVCTKCRLPSKDVIAQICSFGYLFLLPQCRNCNDATGVPGVSDDTDACDTLMSPSFASPCHTSGRFSLVLLCGLLYTHFYYKYRNTNKRKLIRLGYFQACEGAKKLASLSLSKWYKGMNWEKNWSQYVAAGTDSLAFDFMKLVILARSQICLFTAVYQVGQVELCNKRCHANG